MDPVDCHRNGSDVNLPHPLPCHLIATHKPLRRVTAYQRADKCLCTNFTPCAATRANYNYSFSNGQIGILMLVCNTSQATSNRRSTCERRAPKSIGNLPDETWTDYGHPPVPRLSPFIRRPSMSYTALLSRLLDSCGAPGSRYAIDGTGCS